MSKQTCKTCEWSYAVAGEFQPYDAVLGCNPGGTDEFQLAGIVCSKYMRAMGADEYEDVALLSEHTASRSGIAIDGFENTQPAGDSRDDFTVLRGRCVHTGQNDAAHQSSPAPYSTAA